MGYAQNVPGSFIQTLINMVLNKTQPSDYIVKQNQLEILMT